MRLSGAAPWARGVVLFGALSTGALIAYAPILDNGFCFDDRGIVLENRMLSAGVWGQLLTSGYWQGVTGEAGGLYRPLALAALAVERSAFAEEARRYHLVSVLLQALAGVAVVAAAHRVLPGVGGGLAGFLFCLHPASTEVVNAVVGTADTLGLTLGVTGAALVLHGRGRMSRGAALLALAPLAKENAVVFAAGVAAAAGMHRQRRPRIALAAAGAAVLAVGARWLATGHLGPGGIGFLDNPLAFGDLAMRAANAGPLAMRYLRLVVFPWPLSADYSYDQIRLVPSLVSADALVPAAALGSAAVLLLRLARSQPWVALWAGASAGALAISTHVLVPIGTLFAERLAYPLTATMAMGVAWALVRMWHRRAFTAGLVAVIWVGTFALLDRDRTRDWRDDGTLFARAVEVSPRSARSHFGLGRWLHGRGDLRGALAAYDRALAIFPRYTDALYNRGAALLSLGRPREALAAYVAAAETRPEHVAALFAIAALRERLDGPEAAMGAYAEVLRLRPSHEGAARGLARSLVAAGKPERALSVRDGVFGEGPARVSGRTSLRPRPAGDPARSRRPGTPGRRRRPSGRPGRPSGRRAPAR